MNEAVPPKSLKTQTLNLPQHRDAFYGGKWHKAKSGRAADSINPGTGESLGPVADCGAADIDAAVQAAKAAFPAWRDTPPLERARMLKRIANVLREHAEELALIDAADCGNPFAEMVKDATIAAAQIEFYAGLVTEMKGASVPMGPGVVNFSVREPRGVVGRIIPFNHPFMFCAGKAGAPLAAGNTVVMKPPDQAPLSSLRLAELIGDILPPGVFNLVPGGREAGSSLASHPDVAMIALIGSVPTGRAVMKAAADTLKAVMLELGGKNALIAYPDADPGRSGRRRDRRHEFHLVRAVLRLDQPRLHSRENLRSGARQGENQDRPLQTGRRHRPVNHHGFDHLQDPVRTHPRLHRQRQAGRRAASYRRRPAERSGAGQGLLHRADGIRRRAADDAHCARGDFRTRPRGVQME